MANTKAWECLSFVGGMNLGAKKENLISVEEDMCR